MTEWMRGNDGRTRPGALEPIGVVDIGSNSVRLVIYEGAVRAPTPLFNEKVLCGLGRSVATTGRLGAESVERTLKALTRFRAIARVLAVKNIRVIATAAVRDAADGPEFIQRAEKACGCPIQVLSGEREAELAAQGIIMGFGRADGLAADLGGGSMEIIDIVDNQLRQAATLPLGGLRLMDVTGNRMDRALAFADEQLDRTPWVGAGRGRTFYAVGGTWRTLARLHMEEKDYPLHVMHGYSIPGRDAIAFCESLRKGKRPKGFDRVARARREVLPLGALVMERVLKRMEPEKVVFSVFGIREGLVFGLLSKHERDKDPLISFCEDYARLRSRSVAHGHELCDWTDAIFTEPGPRESPEERRLRHAACLLSDIGWRAHPDYRGEQSLNVIAHAALSGVDHADRLFLALTVYFRHDGGEGEPRDFSSRVKKLIDKRAFRRARILGAAIRTAHMMSVGMAGIIDETKLVYERNKLILVIPKSYRDLDGERLRRRFDALCTLLEVEPEVRFSG